MLSINFALNGCKRYENYGKHKRNSDAKTNYGVKIIMVNKNNTPEPRNVSKKKKKKETRRMMLQLPLRATTTAIERMH